MNNITNGTDWDHPFIKDIIKEYGGLPMPKYRNSREIIQPTKKQPKWEYRARNLFWVYGTDKDPYAVDLENHTCTCPSWSHQNGGENEGKRNCKHLDMMRVIVSKIKKSFEKFKEKEEKNNPNIEDVTIEYAFSIGYQYGVNEDE